MNLRRRGNEALTSLALGMWSRDWPDFWNWDLSMNRNYGLRWQAQRDGAFGRPNQLSMNWRSGLRSTCRGKAVSPLRSVTALHMAAARFMVPMRVRLWTKELPMNAEHGRLVLLLEACPEES